MDKLALQLNDVLKETSIYSLLSDYGTRMYVPKGIIVQSAEAKQKAKRFNATIGVALEKGSPMFIPSMKAQFADTMAPGEIFPYAPMGGVMDLRKKWLEDMKEKNPSLKDKAVSLPVVCSGLTNALSIVCSIFLDKDDSVVLPDMYWENYNLILDEQRQAKKVLFPVFNDNGFNVEALDKAIESVKGNKVAIILNFPNNPTGYTPTNKESEAIAQVLKKHADSGKKLLVVSDDAYFGLFFEEDTCTESLFAKVCDLSPNILGVKCDAATKEEMVWGFRIAFITYGCKGFTDAQYDALVQKTMGAIRGTLSNCTMSGQNILLKGMKAQNYKEDKKAGIAKVGERYFALKKALEKYKDKTCLKPFPFNSGYFMSFQCQCKAEDLRQHLLEKYGTGVIRLDDNKIRLAFSSVDIENIEALVDTVYEGAEDLCK